ncbi:hypothetical protein DVR14_00855 (plasmid) [Natrinema thermotolerans]|nr:hypothetical protein DVR14_00855 [Natrinema thermotolerans]
MYVADKDEIAVFDETFTEQRRIDSPVNSTYGLQVESDTMYLAGSDDGYVYETNLEGDLLETAEIRPDLDGENINGFGLYNDHWYVGTVETSEQLYEFHASIDRSETVTGRVTDQHGTPIRNASVSSTAVLEPGLDATDPDALEAEADALLSDLSDPLPSAWDPNYDLESHTEASGTYALVHEPRDWDLHTTTVVDSSIEDPRLTVDSEREVVLSLWDPSAGGGLVGDQIDNSFPGGTTAGEIRVEQLAGSGGTLETRTYETEPIAETSGVNPADPNVHEGVRTHLPVGVYRVAPADNPAGGYVVTVGEPEEIAASITADARDEADRLTQRAERVRSLVTEETLVRETVRTDSEGRFSLAVDERAVAVRLTALKADGTALEGVGNASLEDLREARVNGYNGSVYLPDPTGTEVSPPASNVTVDVYRSPRIPNGDLESYADLQAALEGQLLNESTAELDRWAERLAEIDSDRRERLRENLSAVLSEADRDAELRELQREIAELEQTLEIEPPDLSREGETVSGTFPIDGVTDANVTVLAHRSDGETRVVPSEYYRVESGGLLGTDRVTVSEYPLSGVSSVAFEVVVDGETSGTVREAIGTGDGPAIDALVASTLSPGPDERVSLDVKPSAESSYDGLAGASVFAPDGEAVNASVTDGEATFRTAGEGIYHVRLTVRDDSGAAYVLSERLRAEPVARSDPPTLRAASGPIGEYVVASGVESARVETGGGGVDLTAVVGGEGTPPEIHVMPDAVLESADSDLSLEVVRGSDETAVQSNIGVVIHSESVLDDSALVRRNGEAIPHTGSRYGELTPRNDGSKYVFRSYTDSDGELTVGVNVEPNALEQAWHWVERVMPSPEVPYWLGTVVPVVGVGRVVRG